MLSTVVLALALISPSDPVPVGPSSLGANEPPVRLWLNGDRRFEPGDRARVQVEARDDGYLLVLNYDTDGRLRVLFPLEPRDDGFVRGGRRYEIRSEEDRSSFTVGEGGAGFVYVALSPDPWQLRSWSRGDRWDYDAVSIDSRSEDPERELTRLLEGVSTNRGFDYDLVEYFVADVEIVRHEYGSRFGGPGVFVGCDPYWESGWYCGGRSGPYLSFGRSYLGSWWSIGYGPSWYWPSAWDYRYRPYSYGPGSYRYTYHRPWVTYAPTYRPRPGQPILVGRARGYDVDRYTPWSFDAINRAAGGARPASRGGDDYRPRGESGRARPAPEREANGVPGKGRPATDRAPAAGRARPAGSEGARPAPRPAADRGPARAPANPPARSRGRSRGGNEDLALESRPAPETRSVTRDDARGRSVREAPRADRAPVERQAAPRREAPPAARPESRREAPPANRAAPSQRRADPPARSRGGRSRGN